MEQGTPIPEKPAEESEEVKRIHKVISWAKSHPWLAVIAGLGGFLPLAAIVWNMAVVPVFNFGADFIGSIVNYDQMRADINTNKENSIMFGAMIAGEMEKEEVYMKDGEVKYLYISNTGDKWYRRECDDHWFSALYLDSFEQHFYVDLSGHKWECWNDQQACPAHDHATDHEGSD